MAAPDSPEKRSFWQLLLIFLVAWAALLGILIFLLPGVNLDQKPLGQVSLLGLTALIGGRIAWQFR